MPELASLWWDTLRALAKPRRAAPIAVVVGTMLYAEQRWAGQVDAAGLAPALAMTASFLLLAPFSWRALFPVGEAVTLPAVRLLLYGIAATTPTFAGMAAQSLLQLDETFVVMGFHLPVTGAMFLAGGWGLGRDIDLERGISTARATAAQATERANAAAREAERAQLLAMRAQLDPHFLFNTLNAIAEWVHEDPKTAEAAILRLAGLLREVLGGIRAPSWSVERELAIVQDYLGLFTLRDPGRYTVEWKVPGGLSAEVPPLLLLPIVENAITHGPAKGHRGPLIVEVLPGELLTIRVSNPGPCGPPRPDGTGVAMVRSRLRLAYGDAATMTIGGDPQRTVVELRIPGRVVGEA